MNRPQVTATLEYHRQELTEQFGVRPLAVFGSTARNQATAASDVDLVQDLMSCTMGRVVWNHLRSTTSW